MVCDMLHCLAWIHDRGAPLHPYIPYYNRAAVLSCTASGVAVVSGICGGAALDGMPSGVSQAVYSRLCSCCIVCAGIGLINGNATVKLCKRFWCCGGIIALIAEKPL